MNEDQYARRQRRDDGHRRVRLVTGWVVGGAVAVAAALGIGFAQQSSSAETQTTDTGSTNSGSTNSGTTQGDQSWQSPGSTGSGSSSHGSTGGS